MDKIAIMGGTFDPIHAGHIIAAQSVFDTGLFKEVWFMPSGNPPHKTKDLTDGNHRLAMCRLTLKDLPNMVLSDYEFKRQGIIYSVDTFEGLQKDYPNTQFYLIIGTDSVKDLYKWYEHERLMKATSFVVVERGGHNHKGIDELMNNYYNQYGTDFITVDMPQIELSSSSIRQRLTNGQSVAYRLSTDVIQYIQSNNLYI